MNEEIPKDVQWVITNRCNLAHIGVGHCKVPYYEIPELISADIDRIFGIIDILAKLKMEVKILGGNPSDLTNFKEFVKRMNQSGLRYAITDHAVNQKTIIETVRTVGISGLIFSIDTLKSIGKNYSGFDIGGCSPVKSAAALSLIPEIRGDVSYIGVNTIIHAGNLEQIVPIVKYCTDELGNVIVNLCPLQYGSLLDERGKNLYIFRPPTQTVSRYILRPKHEPCLGKLIKELIDLKKSGYKIGVPIEYLELIQDNACGKSTWNCDEFETCPILRIFPNGYFGICSDLIGRDMQRAKLTPFDLLTNFAEVNKEWLSDSDRQHCCKENGCLWSNICIADFYQQKGLGTISATAKNL